MRLYLLCDRSSGRKLWLNLPGDDGLFDFRDCLGYLDLAGASIRAVEDRAALPYTECISHYFQPFIQVFVAGIKDEAMGLNNGGRADVFVVGPEAGAR